MTTSQTSAFNTPSGRAGDTSLGYGRNRPMTWSDSFGGQWGAMAAGAVTGVAVAVLMATLGAALGMTATATVASATDGYAATAEGLGQAAAGFGIGAGIWLLLSAAVVGIVGGSVLATMAHGNRAYYPRAHGFMTWALGVAIAVLFATSGAGAISTTLGVGAAGAAGTAAGAQGMTRSARWDAPSTTTAPGIVEGVAGSAREAATTDNRGQVAADAAFGRNAPALTPAERESALRAAELAAEAAATAAWFALFALLIGLGATLGAASRRKLQGEPGLAQIPA